MPTLIPLPHHLPAIRRWLSWCIALVMLMVVVGGVTRLTESGLSIVEWKLLSGSLPPLSETAWQHEFAQYKTSPQFQQVNSDFDVNNFKRIYWLEYVHRLLGRMIGLLVAGGTLYFSLRRYLPRALRDRMVLITLLVGAQGMVGWIMVASGLVDQPRVAPIKLALHLLLAFSLYMALLWTRWQVMGQARTATAHSFAFAARALLAVLLIQVTFGALVAGLRAGLTYNTYPLMDGQFIPDGLYLLEPWWRNPVDSALTVQFQHRMGALALAASVAGISVWGWSYPQLRPLLKGLTLAIAVQFCLGISTLLSHVDLRLASLHQWLALWLVGLVTRLVYRTGGPRA